MTLRRLLIPALICAGLPPLAAAAAEPPTGTDQEVVYHVFMGELAVERGDGKTAAQEYLSAARLSADPTLSSHAAIVTYGVADYAASLEAARRWQSLAADKADATQFVAVVDARLGDAVGAAQEFEMLAELPKGHGFLSDAQMLEEETDAVHALPVLQRVAADEMQSAEAHHALAHAAMQYKQYPLAEQEARAALALDPKSNEALVLLARALVSEGRVDEALPPVQKRVAAAPGDPQLHLAYAALLEEAGRDAAAQHEFETILAAQPNEPQALYTLGLMSLQQKQFDAAHGYFMRLLKTGRRTDDAEYFLGSVAEQQKQYPAALDWYHRVEDGDRWMAAQAGIGRSLVENGTPDTARGFFDALVGDYPDDAVTLRLEEAEVFSDLGDPESALQVYNAALADTPDNDDLLYSRAILLEQDGKADQAERDLDSILKRKPDDVDALNALGYTLTLHTTRYREAHGYIEKALQLSPDDPAIMDSMGWVDHRLGNDVEALTYLRKAYAAEADSEIAAHLVEVLLASGDKDEARALLVKAREVDPDNQALKSLQARFTP